MKYAVALEGEAIDLDDLREIFRAGPIRVTEIDVPPDARITALMAEEIDSLASDTLVPEITRRLLAQINGALFASDPDRSVVRLGPIYIWDLGGKWHLGPTYGALNVKMAPMRGRARATVFLPDGTPVPPPEARPRQILWLELASADTPDGDRVADVLHALSREPDWFDLWKAEEVFHCDKHAIPSWPGDDVEWFRKTSTLHRHSPSRAKEAQEWLQSKHKSEMDLEPARRLVGRITAKWLDWMVSRGRL